MEFWTNSPSLDSKNITMRWALYLDLPKTISRRVLFYIA